MSLLHDATFISQFYTWGLFCLMARLILCALQQHGSGFQRPEITMPFFTVSNVAMFGIDKIATYFEEPRSLHVYYHQTQACCDKICFGIGVYVVWCWQQRVGMLVFYTVKNWNQLATCSAILSWAMHPTKPAVVYTKATQTRMADISSV